MKHLTWQMCVSYSEKNLSLGNSDFSFHLFFQVLLNVARVRLFKERKMHSVIREIVFYFLFVWVVLLIAYAHRDPYAHHMTQNMENLFVIAMKTKSTSRGAPLHRTTTSNFTRLVHVTQRIFCLWKDCELQHDVYENGKRQISAMILPSFPLIIQLTLKEKNPKHFLFTTWVKSSFWRTNGRTERTRK